ncbi:ester cyclase [Salinigranum salinum]|uniref:ester cyclase n=1 Tax=Salinigranum salinum TaxID=1364937 RepID=UPI00126109EF|nr:ester cyclase [Salinigranum salinum]
MTEDWRTADELDVERMIEQSTHEIWDQKLVGKIYDYYADDVVVHAAGGDIVGSEALVQDTLARLHAFPETEMNIEKVIWEGNPEDGYYTSMVRTITAENTGPTEYGPPTGKTMEENLGIANCLIQKVDGEWKYVEEWIVYDKIGFIKACTPDDAPIHEY